MGTRRASLPDDALCVFIRTRDSACCIVVLKFNSRYCDRGWVRKMWTSVQCPSSRSSARAVTKPRRRPVRKPLPEDLPREVITPASETDRGRPLWRTVARDTLGGYKHARRKNRSALIQYRYPTQRVREQEPKRIDAPERLS
jgi:hypothetical protein